MFRIIFFITVFAVASTARAQFVLLPEIFAVTNVAANDTLNVRAAASASSEDIGDLYPSQRIEVVSLSPDGKWGEIIWGESNGWIAMRFLARQHRATLPDSGLPLNLICSGTEPFWSAELTRAGELVFTDYAASAPTPNRNQITLSSRSLNLAGSSYAFVAGSFSGILSRGACSDGMSDVDFGWSLGLIQQNGLQIELRNGCCRASIN